MLQDLRYAFRNLRRSPVFTIVALFSVALGIGANTAIFTVADQLLLRQIPVKNASALVQISTQGPQQGSMWGMDTFSYPMFQEFRDHNRVLQNIAARFATGLNLTHNNRSERI